MGPRGEVLYIKNSVPIKKAQTLIEGEDYFDEVGDCYEYLGESNFVFKRQSPLLSGEKIDELSNVHAQKLFWILSDRMK